MSQPPPSTSGGDTVSSDPQLSAEPSLDTSVLKDLAKTSLIETLNEVRQSHPCIHQLS